MAPDEGIKLTADSNHSPSKHQLVIYENYKATSST